MGVVCPSIGAYPKFSAVEGDSVNAVSRAFIYGRGFIVFIVAFFKVLPSMNRKEEVEQRG